MSMYFKDDELSARAGGGDNSFLTKVNLYYNAISDKVQFYKHERWIGIGILGLFFVLRIFMTGGIIYKLIYRLSCSYILSLYSFTEFIHRIYFPSRRS
jgi:hypothetical protein